MRSLKVLVIEHQPARLLQLHQMLNACGVYGVRVAEEPVSARRCLERRGPVDIVVVGSQATCALGFLDQLAQCGHTHGVIIQGSLECPQAQAAVRRARQAGLWVLGVLPFGQAICPLHAMLCRFKAHFAEPLIA
jgi:hypothetical protein